MAKIGEGHAKGMFRKGAVELGQYLPAFNQAGTQTVEDAGVFPNATTNEISNEKQAAMQKVADRMDKLFGQAPDQGQSQQQENSPSMSD